MKRRFGWVWKLLVLLAAILVIGLSSSLIKHARGLSQHRITQYHATAVVAENGWTQVQLELSLDFGNNPGHGPYLVLPLRQAIGNDPNHWRRLQTYLDGVSSPSGADVTVLTEQEDGNLIVRVGDKFVTYRGVQTYVINYRVRGLIQPNQVESGLDEFNWNAVGPGWELPIDSAKSHGSGSDRD